MSVGRALVGCVVLSVQDASVLYPCCKGCFSRVDVDQREPTRFRCSRCGYSCLREQVHYRYRLSMSVTRDGCIFGVTVFGTCLNPFFGIDASGLHRLVQDGDGQVESTRASLLAKAVKDCFIGRHFIFGIKVTGTESGLLFGGPTLSKDGDRVQFIASQMILPKAAGLAGCTVVSYYRKLLQKAAEYELGSKTSRPLEPTLLIRHLSPSSSFNYSTLCASRLLSLSLQRSQHQDSTLSPTPPWQQSLGLVTSSAEQEEAGCVTQEKQNTTHHIQRGCLDKCKFTEERALSPPISLEHRSDNTQSFAFSPNRSFEKVVETTPPMSSWFSPSQPGHTRDLQLICKTKGFSPEQLPKTILSSSMSWEDLPFSESLTEFLCDGHKDFETVGETEPHLNVQSLSVRNNQRIRPQENNLSIGSNSVCQSNTHIAESHSWMLQDITNAKSPARSIRNQQGEEACTLSFENQEEPLEEEPYDCSVDLFGCSPMTDTNIKSPNTHAESVRLTTEPRPLLFEQHLGDINVTHSTPDKQKLRNDLDFIPPAQSTPIVKVDVSASPPSSSFSSRSDKFSSRPYIQDISVFYSELPAAVSSPECDLKKTGKKSFSLCKQNAVSANQLSQCSRESTKEKLPRSTTTARHDHEYTPKRRFWKPNKPKTVLQAQQHLGVRRGCLRLGTPERINHKHDSSVCDVTEDSDVFVPPTPAAKGRLTVELGRRRRKRQTCNSSNNLVSPWKAQQGDGVACKRNLPDPRLSPLASSQRELAPTELCGGGETGDGQSLGGSNGFLPDEENQACDWSRDLFSDSI